MSKLRVGVIGCGGIATMHIRGYLDTGRYEIVGLADLDEAAMAEKDQKFNIAPRHYTDARAMLSQERPDVVSICTWHPGHATWTIAAATFRPRAILCEKPMADTLGRAEQMMVACARNGVKLAIAHQRRFIPSYTLARELIAQGAIGKVRLIQSFAADGLPNYSTHQTDMYRYLLGDEECDWVMGNVERKTDRYERSTRIEDCAVGTFHFTSGAMALLLSDVTPTVYQGAWIYGSDGTINLTTRDLQILSRETGGRWERHEPDGRFHKVAELGDDFEWYEAPAAQMDELADWVEGRRDDFRGAAANGLKALQMVHAVYESARRHEKVLLPMQTRANPLDLMVESGHLAPERPGPYDIRAFLLRGERMLSDTE
ncbi:MAG TPA: Gfo/Idh/MocA family oxidoreductase [Roseiflexaceae bacterium]|nr:Gfo/Idh/MocA family oxidoreductase [Roseiflexaceae bacterium]